MPLNVSKTKCITHLDTYGRLTNCDHDVSICDSKIQVSSVEKLLSVTINNTRCLDAQIDHLIKSVILIYSYCRE